MKWFTSVLATILLVLFSAPVLAGSATLSLTTPTQNDDGTPLVDLAGYKFYWGTTSGSYPSAIQVGNPSITTYVIDNLVEGTYFFVATAYNTAGVESLYSNEATKTIIDPSPNPGPNPPGNLTVVDEVAYMLIKIKDRLVLAVVGTVPTGTLCDQAQPILGKYVVPSDQVNITGTAAPSVVVADCS